MIRASQTALAFLAASSLAIVPQVFAGEIYKIRLSGDGNAYWTGAPNGYVVVEVDANKVTIKQSTLVSNMITGFGKWWDHPILSSRACPEENGLPSRDNCIEGSSGIVSLPPGASEKEYIYEISWNESNLVRTAKFSLKSAKAESQSKPVRRGQ
jgi:hypothetical protein